MDLSIVIPTYNEKGSIPGLLKSLAGVLSKLGKSYEIIFVDDGSSDGTTDVLRKTAADPRVKAVIFRRNFGQTAALSAGIGRSTGEVILTMDADLQNDPGDIPKLLAKIDEGYDIVSGWRRDRKDPFLTKKVPSLLSNWLARKLTGVGIHDFGCSLKAYRKEAIKGVRLYGEMHRYIPAILHDKGFKVAEVEVNHRPRVHGKTKYGTSRLVKGFLDLVYIKFWSTYSTRPLHFFGTLGITELIAGLIIGLYKVFVELQYFKIPLNVGPLLLLSVMLLITGFQFLIFGFIVEIQIRTYFNSSVETEYTIKETIN